MMGGGVGALRCPQFLNAMATARQRGGANSPEGVRAIDPWLHYVLGFQTGFNSEAKGLYDVFQSLDPESALSALYAIEPWCAKNPDQQFSIALLVLARGLRAKQTGE